MLLESLPGRVSVNISLGFQKKNIHERLSIEILWAICRGLSRKISDGSNADNSGKNQREIPEAIHSILYIFFLNFWILSGISERIPETLLNANREESFRN